MRGLCVFLAVSLGVFLAHCRDGKTVSPEATRPRQDASEPRFLSAGRELRFASYYGAGMVLQRAPERAVVWGYGGRKAPVLLTLAGPQGRGIYNSSVADGIWRVMLDPVDAGGPYNITVTQEGSSSSVTLTDVLFGDIWLCGGQSNMAFTVAQLLNASEELAQASKFPSVRIFMVALEQSDEEMTDLTVEVPWSVPTAALLGEGNFTHFSAVCWLFGRYLFKSLQYPIGLVQSCWGGTPVEAWSSSRVIQHCGVKDSMDRDFGLLSAGPIQKSVLWNAMIHPLLNMTLKGAIWYQGEANSAYNRDKYNCTFPSMIDDWRTAFHSGSGNQTASDFPFGFVQLSTWKKNAADGFPEIRWHQTADYGFAPNERMKHTFMAVALDLPDAESPWGSIHPRFKQDAAYRLMLGARAVAYGEKGISFQGPYPISVNTTNTTHLVITYNQDISATQSENIFEICCSKEPCGYDSSWTHVPMMPQGPTTVTVLVGKCPMRDVSSLRYAWTDWPCDFKACPIYSADRVLPAPPFICQL
ncbi:sialate O-acetylesterase isoform X1 [Denticeps clupeoides]|uniref:sialate O-acetylesterase isoform X1 n=1 Tax=Denticeps clupeoides TaxID=299321 RepID=UPI0010A59040|nr:sialate O-acetylesterase isoform X1 [Denticeps clupeoides]